MANQQPKQQKDPSGNPFHPGGDDPGHAPESGEPTEMGRRRGRPVGGKGDSTAGRQGGKGGDRNPGPGRRGTT
jgi:hypothetical protein